MLIKIFVFLRKICRCQPAVLLIPPVTSKLRVSWPYRFNEVAQVLVFVQSYHISSVNRILEFICNLLFNMCFLSVRLFRLMWRTSMLCLLGIIICPEISRKEAPKNQKNRCRSRQVLRWVYDKVGFTKIEKCKNESFIKKSPPHTSIWSYIAVYFTCAVHTF